MVIIVRLDAFPPRAYGAGRFFDILSQLYGPRGPARQRRPRSGGGRLWRSPAAATSVAQPLGNVLARFCFPAFRFGLGVLKGDV